MNGDEEAEQTIQFYKVQLMTKKRIIQDFNSDLKKKEFKFNRQLKEAKTSQQRAKKLLKDQKAKVDKLSKQANENQQQNNLLLARLATLKEQKQKEVSDVRSAYNKFKQEVRSYERILPTHTFLTEMGTSIDQLPTYEDIFTNLKQKIYQFNEIQSKFQVYKTKMQEQIRVHEQNEQMLKTKKLQAQRNLKQILPRIIQYEHQISDLKINNEQYQQIINDLKQQLQNERLKVQSLQENIKQYEIQIENIRQVFTNQLHNKQQQVRCSFMEQIDRYQQQIKSLSSRFQVKQNGYLNQLHIMQEEIVFLQNKSQIQKEKYQQIISEVKQQIQLIKSQYERMKLQNNQLKLKNDQTIKNLLQLSLDNDQLQQKLKGIQKKSLQLQQNNKKQSVLIEQKYLNQIQQLNSKIYMLNEDNMRQKQLYLQVIQQKQNMKQQNNELRQQITNNKMDNEFSNHKNLQLPYNAFQYEQRYRRKSTQFQKYQQEVIIMQLNQKQELEKQKQKSIEYLKKIQEIQNQKEAIRKQIQIVRLQLNGKNQQLIELREKLSEKIMKIDNLLNEVNEIKSCFSIKEKELNEQKQKLSSDNHELKQKISILTKNLNQSQLNMGANNTKQNLLKTKIESLQGELKIILQQDKKNKELIKNQKQQLKLIKQNHTQINDKNNKQIKQLVSQIQILKQQKDHIKNEYISKQKALHYQIALLKNNKELQQKLKEQINLLNNDISRIEAQKADLSKKINQISKEYELSKKQIHKLQLENIQKDRQNELINQSLNRERRQRTLRTVPSLQSLQDEQQAKQQNFNDIYSNITRKQGEINILQRQNSDLKQEIQSLRITHACKIQELETENNSYIGTIIEMKMKCAESQMKASTMEHLYNQFKKKRGGF